MRLLDAELRRFHARRMIRALLLVGLVVVLMMAWGTWQQTRPLSSEARAAATAAYERDLADWQEVGQEMVDQCLADEAAAREENGDPTLDYGCQDMAPRLEWYLPTVAPLGDALVGQLLALSYLIGFLALAAGTTFTAAEVSTRALSTWLTFAPRRLPVMGAKLLAAAAGVVLPAAALVAALVGATWGAYALNGADTSMSGQQVTEVVHIGLRLVVLTVLVAVAAASLGLLMRHTAAVLAVAVGYLAVIEGVLANLVTVLQPWLIMLNVRAWVSGSASWVEEQCTTGQGGLDCAWVEHTVSMGRGLAYLALLLAVVLVTTGLVFRRRDVA